MVSISMIGILIILAIYLPKLLITFFPARDRMVIKYNSKEKQVRIIEKISLLGCISFSFIDIAGYGYKFLNLGLEIGWIIVFVLLVMINYSCYLRFYINGRKYDNLYDRILIPYPIGISECLIFIMSGFLLINPFVMVFSIFYFISHLYLGLRGK